MTKLISFSGGRSSAMMLKIMQDNGQLFDAIVMFANTGKEHEATLEFVRDCGLNWGINIIWVEYQQEKPKFKFVDFETASRNGEPFEALVRGRKYLPNAAQRLCTVDLKVKTIKRALKQMGVKSYDTYMGIRADEPRRYDKHKADKEMPLYDLGIKKPDVRRFWDAQPFDLKIPDGMGNCDLCFMKGKAYTGKLVELMRMEPARADWWIEQEKRAGATFIKGVSYSTLKHIATNQTQFKFPDFDPNEVELDCSCGG